MDRLSGIIFDLDGTIADTIPVCLAAFRATFLEHTGRHFTDAEIQALFGPSEEGSLQRVLHRDWERGMDSFLIAYEAAHDGCEAPFSGIVSALDWLARKKVKVAVVTGKGPKSAAISLNCLGLDGRFEIVEAGAPEGPIKPDSIRRVLAAWGAPAERVAYLGDSPSDVDAARSVGLCALSAMWAPGALRESILAKSPDAAFETVDAFRAWLEERVG